MDQQRMFLVPGVAGPVRSSSVRKIGDRLPADALTRRQREILIQLAEGRSTKEVAANLGISSKTADAHRAQIMQKLGLRSQSELIFFAIRAGIVRLS
jgi:DNA-binding CsgD family transcriptional regulator